MVPFGTERQTFGQNPFQTEKYWLICFYCLVIFTEQQLLLIVGKSTEQGDIAVRETKPIINGPKWLEEISSLIDPNKPVLVYKNLHKNLFSVRQGAKVVCHVTYIFLSDIEFVVSEKGRNRVRKEKRKSVHAFVKGLVSSPKLVDKTPYIGNVTYNPYTHNFFKIHKEGEQPEYIFKCDFADMYVLGGERMIIAY